MKAVQIVNPSEMKVVELEKPVVGAGEVLVRIKYVGCLLYTSDAADE